MTASYKSLTIFFPFFLLIFGCAPRVILPPPEAAPPSHFSAAWEKALRADQGDTFKAIARVEVATNGKKYHLKFALMLKRPSLMRIESLPVIGPPDFFLSLNNEHLKAFLPGKNEFYLGQPSPENFSRFFPLHLPPSDVVSVMTGVPPITGIKPRFRGSTEGGNRRLDLFLADDKIQTLFFNRDDDRLTGMEILSPHGEIIYSISYNDYRKVGNIEVPQKITLISPETNATIVIRYTDMEFNRDGDDGAFDLTIPSWSRTITLD